MVERRNDGAGHAERSGEGEGDPAPSTPVTATNKELSGEEVDKKIELSVLGMKEPDIQADVVASRATWPTLNKKLSE
jgi:hypothetical protein